MADYTVSDIQGKGFKYDFQIQEASPPPATGTIAALFGTAHWGPVGSPRFITDGKTELNKLFGDVDSDYDDGLASMRYNLSKVRRGWFTRISDGTDSPAYVKPYFAAEPAVAVSANSISPSAIALTPATNSLNITIADTVPPYSHVLSVVFTGSALAEQAFVEKTGLGTINYGIGDQIVLTINGTPYTATVAAAPFSGTGANLATLLTTGSYGGATVTWGPSNPSPGTVTFGGTATTFTITSVAYGTTQTVTITSDTGSVLIGAAGANTDTGVNSNHSSIVSQINAAIPPAMLTAYPGYVAAAIGTGANANKLVITSPTTGSTVTITTAGTANSLIALPTPVTGVALKYIGTFRSKQTGRLGNTISAVLEGDIANGNQLTLFFNGVTIGTFVNFTYDSNDANYLGTLLSQDYFTKDIVEYNHAVDENDVALVPAVLTTEEIPEGTWTCANGTSGDSGITPSTDLIPLIQNMTNIDIYDFDVIAAPGYPDEDVQDALQATVEKRQDSITAWETPLLTTVSSAIQWTNGLGAYGRDNKIESMYAATYYPYVKCNKRLFKTPSSTEKENKLDDRSPLIRVIGAISQNDNTLKSTFGAPAGIRTVFDDVKGLQKLLSEDEKTLMYGDVYDGILNPIVYTTEDGFFIDGQKTGARRDLAKNKTPKTSRLNVTRTSCFIKKSAQKKSKFFFFTPSDTKSWEEFKKMLESIMVVLEEKRAIEPKSAEIAANRWSVICDRSTNTEQVISDNGMVAVIEWCPIESIERIKIVSTLKERQLSFEVTVS